MLRIVGQGDESVLLVNGARLEINGMNVNSAGATLEWLA